MDFKNEIKEYYAREIKVIEELDADELNKAMNALLEHYEKETNIYVFGNGGSSATASHMVCDFNKGTCYNVEKRFRFICLNDNIPTMMALANDVSFDDVFYYQLENKLKKEDLVLAISGSGNSHNVIKAVEYAKKVGCEIMGMTGYDGGKLDKMSDYHLHVPADDMQITEDLHMGFDHMIMQIFWKYLEKREGKNPVYKINK
ncbi:MAG: SIS domain-containing protein [Bacilli bacterium]|nr:SIS domain-containing protein [Bacilli bacterium]MCH4210411.1 SIS domain-containing protein [Bacilli bacterium]MCH4229032.1 SIS domain-containing protein [Bacilli bacterium]MCH4278246.1 SIS domain-containing protein [Bacilli bacterium]MCI2055041.1 SIS domain-containing protein [Bacilli bacterium]